MIGVFGTRLVPATSNRGLSETHYGFSKDVLERVKRQYEADAGKEGHTKDHENA